MSRTDEQAALLTQVGDLRAEGDALYELLQTLSEEDWSQATTFKDWTIYDVIAHLHFSDHMGVTTLASGADFKALMRDIQTSRLPMVVYTRRWLGDIDGPQLQQRWRSLFLDMCDRLGAASPGQRLTWAGPGMRPRMFATARQMETWAHAWEIYDRLGVPRVHSDRLFNIATIGVRTFGWSFTNRKLEVPTEVPYVRLTAPSGAIWEWNDPGSENRIQGDAVAFCQVVTQVRNVADTDLSVSGETAERWMAIAQCFAGPPEDPPAPGSRA